ncbi:MAG: hypothetical protein WBK91_08010 [Alphaproteobacteria bacterium]
MYLFTLIFIFLTIIGVFTEVLSMQNSRFFARQVSGASVIATWHNAVVDAARYRTAANLPAFPNWGAGGTACTVLATGAAALPQAAACPDASGAADAMLDTLVIAPGPVTVTTVLPPLFTARFQSVIFTSTTGNARLAVTFINPPANANDVVAPTGYTMSQLYRQLGRLNLDKSTYGYVVGTQLQPAAPPAAGAGFFGIPNGPGPVPDLIAPTGPIQNGALALFTLI